MEEKITAWVARDEDGGLYIYTLEPNKEEDLDFWTGFGDNLVIDRHFFPQVKWEDEEPTKVELTIKIK